eukprot:GHVH01011776.1.p1 GENE.GHVH01011776.1~~GHVH01011776.1.p1  ORF type:complete len:442 (+),score=55.76 GHVH01011776.1:544-1869(+)
MKVHFHEFLLRVQFALYDSRTSNASTDSWLTSDPIMALAHKIRGSGVVLLCFDEFQVTSIGDAMILKELFQDLVHFGVQVATTSNRPPRDLYKNGLNRDRFVPFIDMMEDQWDIFEVDTDMDFRSLPPSLPTTSTNKDVLNRPNLPHELVGNYWNTPSRLKSQLEKLVRLHVGAEEKDMLAVKIPLMGGRFLLVPTAVGNMAVCSFISLFENNVGSADFLGLSAQYHTLLIHSIPQLADMETHAYSIRRFITFVDIIYDNDVQCVFDSDVPLLRLFPLSNSIKAMDNFLDAVTHRWEFIHRGKVKMSLSGLEEFLRMRMPRSSDGLTSLLRETYDLEKEDCDILLRIFQEPLALIEKNKTMPEYFADRVFGTLRFHIDYGCTSEEREELLDLSATPPETPAIPYDVSAKDESAANEIDDNRFAFIRTLSRLIEMCCSQASM